VLIKFKFLETEVGQLKGLENNNDDVAINKLKSGKNKFWFGDISGNRFC
jgi:hypothetical protein